MWKGVDLHFSFPLYYNGKSSVKSICNVPQYLYVGVKECGVVRTSDRVEFFYCFFSREFEFVVRTFNVFHKSVLVVYNNQSDM